MSEEMAFPVLGSTSAEQEFESIGLTKREYFAAAALTGACALSQSLGDSGMCGMTASEAAAFAVAAADETLRRLSKDPQQ